jgi:hypothetical protein
VRASSTIACRAMASVGSAALELEDREGMLVITHYIKEFRF